MPIPRRFRHPTLGEFRVIQIDRSRKVHVVNVRGERRAIPEKSGAFLKDKKKPKKYKVTYTPPNATPKQEYYQPLIPGTERMGFPEKFQKSAFGVVSKIAMRPIYHGTSKESAKALLKGKPFTSGLHRDGAWTRNGRETIFGTTQSNKDYAQSYTYHLARKKNGKLKLNRKGKAKSTKGTTLIYNGVGVRTTHPNNKPTDLEQNFFADELGSPVGSIKTKESIQQWAKRTTRQGNPYGSPKRDY